jgi:hypothetical protein
MKKAKYVLVPVLITLVVLVVSLYPPATVTRKASAAPRAAVITKYLMIPAAAFSPIIDGMDYYNWGTYVGLSSGDGDFYAPVYLPPGARFRLIKLYAVDGNPQHNLCAVLYETYPKASGDLTLQMVCTAGSSGLQQPMKYLSHYVKWYNGYYIMLYYVASANLDTYAVMIKYNVRQ